MLFHLRRKTFINFFLFFFYDLWIENEWKYSYKIIRIILIISFSSRKRMFDFRSERNNFRGVRDKIKLWQTPTNKAYIYIPRQSIIIAARVIDASNCCYLFNYRNGFKATSFPLWWFLIRYLLTSSVYGN